MPKESAKYFTKKIIPETIIFPKSNLFLHIKMHKEHMKMYDYNESKRASIKLPIYAYVITMEQLLCL